MKNMISVFVKQMKAKIFLMNYAAHANRWEVEIANKKTNSRAALYDIQGDNLKMHELVTPAEGEALLSLARKTAAKAKRV